MLGSDLCGGQVSSQKGYISQLLEAKQSSATERESQLARIAELEAQVRVCSSRDVLCASGV